MISFSNGIIFVHANLIYIKFSDTQFFPSLSHKKAQSALMYDAVFVLVEAFNKLLRKKPDQFRSYTMRNRMGQVLAPVANVSSPNTTASNTNTNRVLDCNTSKGWVNAWLVLNLHSHNHFFVPSSHLFLSFSHKFSFLFLQGAWR